MDKALVAIGVWLLSDGIYSWILYHNAKSYDGEHQCFWKDHWIRLLRIILSISVITIGAVQ